MPNRIIYSKRIFSNISKGDYAIKLPFCCSYKYPSTSEIREFKSMPLISHPHRLSSKNKITLSGIVRLMTLEWQMQEIIEKSVARKMVTRSSSLVCEPSPKLWANDTVTRP
jgi:hypothetical protein